MAISEHLIIPARSEHTATVIFLHGFNSTAYVWQDMASMFADEPAFGHVKWILPHAPQMPVTCKGGAVVSSWYDIFDLDHKLGQDEAGILAASHALDELIGEEVKSGIPANRVVLGGFSQGGALSLVTGLISEWKLAGVVNLSGPLMIQGKLKSVVSDDAQSLPIFWGHGRQDVIVTYAQWIEDSMKILKSDLGLQMTAQDSVHGIEFHAYKSLGHSTCDEEFGHLRVWLQRVVPSTSSAL